MFAYIKILGTNELKIVNVNDRQKFKADAPATKKFNIKIGNKTEQCTVSHKADTEEELAKILKTQRARFPPANLLVTASEDEVQTDKTVTNSLDPEGSNIQNILEKKLALKDRSTNSGPSLSKCNEHIRHKISDLRRKTRNAQGSKQKVVSSSKEKTTETNDEDESDKSVSSAEPSESPPSRRRSQRESDNDSSSDDERKSDSEKSSSED